MHSKVRITYKIGYIPSPPLLINLYYNQQCFKLKRSEDLVRVSLALAEIANGKGDLTRRLETNSDDDLGQKSHITAAQDHQSQRSIANLATDVKTAPRLLEN